jgi:GMP synthase-like glutamine amidotransferase
VRIHSLQHVPFENLASIGRWAERRGHSVSVSKLYAGDPLPDVESFDVLVVLGGPMNADDDAIHPWLAEEKRLIGQAIEAGRKTLGVCLGSQLIARVLGARVYPHEHKEIGWFPVNSTEAAKQAGWFADDAFPAFHWHGDTFDLPDGAVLLATTEACRHQAFAWKDHVLGLQFHLEATTESVAEMLDHERDDLTAGPYVQDEAAIRATTAYFNESARVLDALLDRLIPELA